MPLGLNRNGDYHNGTPITLPHNFGNVIDWTPDPARFGNPVNEPKDFGNKVTWAPDPAHFGNKVGGTPVTPTFDPPAGSYGVPQVIQIIADGTDAIYFTTDGSAPTTASRLYQGSVYIPKSETVKAISVTNGVPSSVGSAAYVITSTQSTQPTPTFSPVAGTYSGTQNVTITSASADAIYYTTDGSTPTTGSTLYSGPVAVATSETLKALAVRAGFNNSAIGSAAYTITTPPGPVFVTSAHALRTDFGTPAVTSGVDTTGANFLVVVAICYDGNGVTTVTDSLGNTWTLALDVSNLGPHNSPYDHPVRIYYAFNAIVGPAHTFTCASSGGSGDGNAGLTMMAFSGMPITDPIEAPSGSNFNATNAAAPQTVCINAQTPAAINDLAIVGVCGTTKVSPAMTIDSGVITVTNDWTVGYTGMFAGYKIVSSTAALNPTLGGYSSSITNSGLVFFAG